MFFIMIKGNGIELSTGKILEKMIAFQQTLGDKFTFQQVTVIT